jgi:alcohol dehydrogenase class IV
MDAFHYVSYAQEVIFGPGSLIQLGTAVERLGKQRLLLCTNHTLRADGHVDLVQSILGERLLDVFDHVSPHVQDYQVDEVLALALGKDIEAVIGFGGGSPIGMAKAVSIALEEKRSGHPANASSPVTQPLIPVIAIPTTYAGSEMTPTYGTTHTHEKPPRKVTVSDPRVAPKLVIYDPELTLDLPPAMTASTGINALAHCMEALYSITRNPLSTAAALSGVRHITSALPRCYTDGKDLEARSEMLLGAHLAGLSLASVKMGLHHGICHVLGGSANVPHGIANSIMLPHVLRFNAEATAPQLLPAAEAMGIPSDGLKPAAVIGSAAQWIYDLEGRMNLPQRLRDAGVKEADLARLAALGFQNRTVQSNPKPITDAIQIETLLREAW